MNKNFKRVISTVAALAMASSSFVAMAATYPDVTADANYYSAIEQLSALGIMEGFDDGTFKPEEKVTRAQMAKLVVGAKNQLAAAEANTTVIFEDVAPGKSEWAIGYVAKAYADDIINGTSATTFDPDATVTYAQAMKMLVNACGYEEYAQNKGGWPNGYLSYGSELEIGKGIKGVGNDTALTRGQVAQMVANAVKAPVLEVTGWYTDDGVKLPSYTQYDGEDGRSFKSLLTEEWNVYEVYGQVSDTKKTLSSLKEGMVNFTVDKADNFDGDIYSEGDIWMWTGGQLVKSGTTAAPVKANVGKTDANDKLYDYVYALIAVDENEDSTIKYIETSAKSEVVEFADVLYAGFESASSYNMLLTKSATTTTTSKFEIDTKAKLIVNGVEAYDMGDTGATLAGFQAAAALYLPATANNYDVAVLIDTPENGKSTDGDYDIVSVDYYATSLVDEVFTNSKGEYVVSADNFVLYVDPEDDEQTYSVVDTNGAAMEITEIPENAVVSVAYDIIAGLNNSNFYDIIVSTDTVEGRMDGSYVENSKNYGTVNGTDYVFTSSIPNSMIGQTFTFYLDKDGRVVEYDLIASSVNYALIDRFYTTAGDKKVRLILKDGSKVDYVINVNNSNYNEDGSAGKTALAVATGLANSGYTTIASDRVVEYSVNSSDEVTLTNVTANVANGDFVANTTRIDGYQIADTTVVLDASGEYATTGQGTVAVSSAANFIDDMNYVAIVAGTKTNGIYPFVVLVRGVNGFTPQSELVVVAGTPSLTVVDGEKKYAIPVYSGTAADNSITYLTTENTAIQAGVTGGGAGAQLAEGDAFIYKKNADGEVDGIAVVKNNVGSLTLAGQTDWSTAITPTQYFDTTGSLQTLAWAGVPTGETAPEFYLAPVTDKRGGSVDLATHTTGNVTDTNTQVKNYGYAAEAKAYAYSKTEKVGYKVSMVTVGGITNSVIPKAAITGAENNIINWTNTDVKPALALIRVYDKDVQEVYSISLN